MIDSGYGFFPSAVSPTEHWFDAPAAQLIFNILLTSVGIWAVPQSVQKFYAIKSDRAITQGTVISFLFALLVGGGAYFNGSLARLFYPEMPAEGTANIIPNILLSNSLMNYAVLGFICVLVLSASMSTLSSLALVSASSIGVDVYKGYIKKDGDEKKLKILIRVLCFFFVALSAVFAILEVDAIVTLMSLSWGTMAGCFIGPYIYGLYWKKANKYGTYASITACLLITIILIFVFGDITGGDTFISLLKLGIKKSPMIGVFCMGSSLIITPVASIVGEKIEALVKAKKVA